MSNKKPHVLAVASGARKAYWNNDAEKWLASRDEGTVYQLTDAELDQKLEALAAQLARGAIPNRSSRACHRRVPLPTLEISSRFRR